MSDPKKEQLEIAERLQLLWLRRMERLLESGMITSTDMATLARLLMQNGWSLDPNALPQGLRDKITTPVSFEDDDDEDFIAGRIGATG